MNGSSMDEETWSRLSELSGDQTGAKEARRKLAMLIVAVGIIVALALVILILMLRQMHGVNLFKMNPIVPG